MTQFSKALIVFSTCLFTSAAFADKILLPGQTYNSSYAGEFIVCMKGESEQKPSFSFLAEGSEQLSSDELRDPNACSLSAKSYVSMLRAQEIAISNGQGIQCKSGYTCSQQQGSVQYRRQGRWCFAYVPFLAVRN